VLATLVVAVVIQDDPGYRGGWRYRVRDRETGDYVYEVTASPSGFDAQQTEAAIRRDLERLTVDEFQRRYKMDSRRDR